MKEKEFYKYDYFQKSKVFLYPLLNFKDNELFKPINTFLYCDKIDESIIDYNLLVLYKFEEKTLFEKFEATKIIPHKDMVNCYLTDDGMLYIFNLSHFSETVDHFINGDYSKFPEAVKKIIYKFHITGFDSDKYGPKDFESGAMNFEGNIYAMTSLYPWIFKDKIAEEMFATKNFYDTKVEAMEAVKMWDEEICPVFDLEKETLVTNVLTAND